MYGILAADDALETRIKRECFLWNSPSALLDRVEGIVSRRSLKCEGTGAGDAAAIRFSKRIYNE